MRLDKTSRVIHIYLYNHFIIRSHYLSVILQTQFVIWWKMSCLYLQDVPSDCVLTFGPFRSQVHLAVMWKAIKLQMQMELVNYRRTPP